MGRFALLDVETEKRTRNISGSTAAIKRVGLVAEADHRVKMLLSDVLGGRLSWQCCMLQPWI